jgi:membrane protein DedA with SNARE-associated domain
MLTALAPWFEHGSYVAVFVVLVLCGVGLPVPEEATFIVAGMVTPQTIPAVCIMIAVGLLGILAGDSLTYLCGRRYGMVLLARWPFNRFLKQENLDKARHFIDRHGSHAVFFAGFLAGVRAPTYFLCGSMGLSYPRFVLWDSARAVLTCPISVYLAWRFGAAAQEKVKEYSHFLLGGLFVVLLFIILRYLRRRRKEKLGHVQEAAQVAPASALTDKPAVKETSGT